MSKSTAQDELETARDRFSDLFDFAPVGYVTVSAKGLVVEANLTLAEMLQVDRGKLLRQPLSHCSRRRPGHLLP